MALPTSGPISFCDIATELQCSTPLSNIDLRSMSCTAGFTTPDQICEFYGYSSSPNAVKVDYILVGGGGGGGSLGYGGGGGAGSVSTGTTILETTSGSGFYVVIGAGGSCSTNEFRPGVQGGSSCAFNRVAYGGGGGGNTTTSSSAGSGGYSIGSGGGGSGTGVLSTTSPLLGTLGRGGKFYPNYPPQICGGNLVIPANSLYLPFQKVTTNHGCDGGLGVYCSSNDLCRAGGGGGGFTSSGSDGTTLNGGNGGFGTTWCDNITCVAGGGGGGGRCSGGNAGSGNFGGGDGGKLTNGCNATANTGSGGGGSGFNGSSSIYGGNGGSGILIFRYSGTTALFCGGTVTTCNGYTYHCVKSSGTIVSASTPS